MRLKKEGNHRWLELTKRTMLEVNTTCWGLPVSVDWCRLWVVVNVLCVQWTYWRVGSRMEDKG